MFSIESPHRGDSNENSQYTIFNMFTKNHPKLPEVCSYEIFSKGLKNEFETAVVNEPSVFEPLKFYCIKPTIYAHIKRFHEKLARIVTIYLNYIKFYEACSFIMFIFNS